MVGICVSVTAYKNHVDKNFTARALKCFVFFTSEHSVSFPGFHMAIYLLLYDDMAGASDMTFVMFFTTLISSSTVYLEVSWLQVCWLQPTGTCQVQTHRGATM